MDPGDFYDSLAADYHLMFRDWWPHAVAHGAVLDRMLRDRGVRPGASVLDYTCGIGTQALPLAELGYEVVGSDLSRSAVARARTEAAARGLSVPFLVSDARAPAVRRTFDVVLSADNSLPHLRTAAGLEAALSSARRCLLPEGVFLASVRNYDELERDRVAGVMPRAYGSDGERRIVGQAWTWSDDGSTVTFDLFMLVRRGAEWDATVRTTVYRAWRRAELTAALTAAGFAEVRWWDPEESGYYQPVVTARAG